MSISNDSDIFESAVSTADVTGVELDEKMVMNDFGILEIALSAAEVTECGIIPEMLMNYSAFFNCCINCRVYGVSN